MTPKYELIYFPVTGLAEPIRYILHYSNVPFKDTRLEWDEWQKMKPDTPFGQLPVLIEDGRHMCQSISICRYLAKKFGLVGENDSDIFEADMIVDTINDLRLHYREFYFQQDFNLKSGKLEEIKQVQNPFYLSKLEKIVTENQGYFIINQLTWADLYFASITGFLSNLIKEPKLLEGYTSLSNLKNKIDSHPNIKKYLDNRPPSVIFLKSEIRLMKGSQIFD